MAERPANVRRTGASDRIANNRRHRADPRADARADEGAGAGHVYRGSHRAAPMHRADEVQASAHQRSSRVGRHHASQHRADYTGNQR